MEPRYDAVTTPLASRPPIPPTAFRQAPMPLHDPSTFFPQISSHEDVFGPISASSTFGTISSPFPQSYYPDQNPAHYHQEQTPTRYYSEQSFHRLGPGVPPTSSIHQGHHSTFSASAGTTYPVGRIGSPPSSMPLNTSGIGGPITPQRPFSGGFSPGRNTVSGSRRLSSDATSTTPPRTAQDLLMRVLGGAGTSQPNPQTSAPNAPIYPNVTRPRHSQSPPRNAATISENQTPLFFGTAGSNSIWAP
jgi:hypothetical protein